MWEMSSFFIINVVLKRLHLRGLMHLTFTNNEDTKEQNKGVRISHLHLYSPRGVSSCVPFLPTPVSIPWREG